jgi:hypothetical protein
VNSSCCQKQRMPKTFGGRCWGIASWLLPGAVLVFMPKCPLCLAAYIAVVTGIGISSAIAITIQNGLWILCVGWLIWWAAVLSWRVFRLRTSSER